MTDETKLWILPAWLFVGLVVWLIAKKTGRHDGGSDFIPGRLIGYSHMFLWILCGPIPLMGMWLDLTQGVDEGDWRRWW